MRSDVALLKLVRSRPISPDLRPICPRSTSIAVRPHPRAISAAISPAISRRRSRRPPRPRRWRNCASAARSGLCLTTACAISAPISPDLPPISPAASSHILTLPSPPPGAGRDSPPRSRACPTRRAPLAGTSIAAPVTRRLSTLLRGARAAPLLRPRASPRPAPITGRSSETAGRGGPRGGMVHRPWDGAVSAPRLPPCTGVRVLPPPHRPQASHRDDRQCRQQGPRARRPGAPRRPAPRRAALPLRRLPTRAVPCAPSPQIRIQPSDTPPAPWPAHLVTCAL